MANEKRLIEVKTAWKKAQRIYSDTVILHCIKNVLDETPTVDAVEVVRCKDCKHCMMCYPEKQIGKEATQGWYCKEFKGWRRPDDFCSYGERRTDGK